MSVDISYPTASFLTIFSARPLEALGWHGLSKAEETVGKSLALLWLMALWWLPFCARFQACVIRILKRLLEADCVRAVMRCGLSTGFIVIWHPKHNVSVEMPLTTLSIHSSNDHLRFSGDPY